jgi:4-diphosphocytidyl-2-C-methyl-D-erythritol kinase
MDQITLSAPAKVNYRLDVMGRRPDGYHDLRMIMQPIDLCDQVTIARSAVRGIRVTCGTAGVPDGEGNIAWRAARALFDPQGAGFGLEIAISKRIPVAAGLGGGSSDAAAVLLGVNRLLGLGLDRQRLMAVATPLGADVPFFLLGGPALAEGIGERLTPLEGIPAAWLALVNPGIPVSTAWAYNNVNLSLTTGHRIPYIPLFYGTLVEVAAILANDLEQVTMGAHPVIGQIKERLLAAGALGTLMSGSGPTVFGLFADQHAAEEASAALATETGWFTRAVSTLVESQTIETITHT